jgi:diguanylate cyclase (GGDEF)-like protein
MMQIIRQSQALLLGVAMVLLVGSIGLLDFTLGSAEISFSVLYVVPVGVATWYLSRSVGYGVAIGALALRGWIDWSRQDIYSSPLVPLDALLIRASLLVGAVWALSKIKTLLLQERQFGRIDYLTEIPNSRAFFEQAQRDLNRCQRTGQPLTLAFLDCDDFKQINDTYGHQIGDTVLRLIAQTFKQRLRQEDFVARLGGDEFVVVLPFTDAAEAQVVLQRLQNSLLEAMEQNSYNITFSIGAVALNPDGKVSVEGLVKQADALMYSSKAKGKCQIILESVSPHAVSESLY